MGSLLPIVLLGAPRSGTTWLQNLLGADPRVATPQETDLFTRYVEPVDAAWQWSLRGGADEWRGRRFKGLPAVLTAEQFEASVRTFVDGVFRAVAELKPTADVVVEKSPSHSRLPELIAKYVPSVRFVHIIRDGRDAAASVVAASQGWGAFWAPGSVGEAARLWREHVDAARTGRDLAPYLELRYEALRGGEGPAYLRDAFAFCGIDIDEAEAKERLNTFRLTGENVTSLVFGGEAANRDGVGLEPDGFFGRGEQGGWHDWTLEEKVAFASEAQELLETLGYESDERWLGEPARVRRVRRTQARRHTAGRVLRAAGSRLARLGNKIGTR